jgi:hypothetical protein
VNVNATAPWGTTFATDIHPEQSRGFNVNSLNTNVLYGMRDLAVSFLKGKPLVDAAVL